MKRYMLFFLSLIIILLLWRQLPLLLHVPSYILPSLQEIIVQFSTMQNIFYHLWVTTYESLLGFIIGSSLAFVLGIVIAESHKLRSLLLPYIISSNAIPVIALAPLLLILFGSGIVSKVAIAAFLCFFPLCQNTYKALMHYDKQYRDLFIVNGGTSRDFLVRYKLPANIPIIFSGLKLNATYAVVGAVVAEFIGSDKGLGYGIIQASYNLNMPRLRAYIIIACLLGLVFYSLVYIIEGVFLKKYRFLLSKNANNEK